MAILVTGGAGYIGSHTVVELLNNNYEVIVVDNLINSNINVIDRINEITKKEFRFYEVDLLDKEKIEKIFEENSIDSVIHFAGLKAVGESCEKPWLYYNNNINSTLTLLDVMQRYKCKKIVFSSSATVYGDPKFVPITEECPKGEITNPYGKTKSMIEEMLIDIAKADKDMQITLLRYFNPIGAHESGFIGEDPKGIPNNLLPYIAQVAVGRRSELSVWGNDYDTIDGTGVRDYIHVVDLAVGHIKALDKMKSGVSIYNLGTGKGYSVLEVVKAFSKACNKEIPYKICDRRPGDIAVCFADASKAEKELGFKAKYDIEDMCKSAWNFQSKNPNGYNS